MLVESIVRKTLGLKRHCVKKVNEEDGCLVVWLLPDGRFKLVCSCCEAKGPGYDTLRERRWKHVPLWGIPVILVYAPRRVSCSRCGVKVEAIPWTQGKSSLSLPLSVVLGTWAGMVAWNVVGQLFGFHWNTVRKAVKNLVDFGLENRDLQNVLYIGIDEISRKKGHVYHTQVYDLEKKRLIWTGAHRDKDSLRRFFEWWGTERTAAIEGVCCDMWQSYIDVIQEYCGKAVIVFDKFHIVRHLMEAVDKVRKMEAKALAKIDNEILKGTRYIWLKNPWNLTDKQKLSLTELLKMNLRVVKAYLLKELFRKLWDYKRRGWAAKYLKRWFWWATHSRIKPLRDFAWMLRRHEEGILAYFDLRINNGLVEAMNNNAKAISHRARGYRTEETFSLAMIHGLGKLELPKSQHTFC